MPVYLLPVMYTDSPYCDRGLLLGESEGGPMLVILATRQSVINPTISNHNYEHVCSPCRQK